ncbi:MAG: hypothetical protein IPK16_20785 [Anaerolineales bacterium]|nr:hypothetical protein [Anaerolineales bacterium]
MAISNTQFVSNTAGYGGGLYSNNGVVTIDEAKFYSNTAILNYGGGLYAAGTGAISPAPSFSATPLLLPAVGLISTMRSASRAPSLSATHPVRMAAG